MTSSIDPRRFIGTPFTLFLATVSGSVATNREDKEGREGMDGQIIKTNFIIGTYGQETYNKVNHWMHEARFVDPTYILDQSVQGLLH